MNKINYKKPNLLKDRDGNSPVAPDVLETAEVTDVVNVMRVSPVFHLVPSHVSRRY